MPHVKEHRFGPGQYESMTFKTWTGKTTHGKFRVHGRLEGTYTIYCGAGWEHDTTIKEDISVWNTEVGEMQSDSFFLFEIHNLMNSVDMIYDLADRLIGYALEDWDDPCEVTEL